MATRPTLERAVADGNLTAPMFNDNFDDTLDYISAVETEKGASITSLQTAVSTLQGENIKTGMIVYYTKSTAPTGYLVCDGSAVSRTTYATLFTAIGTTFGSGDGSTTFNLPNLIDKFPQGNTTVGTVKSAGLPNITGSFTKITDYHDVDLTGAFNATYPSGAEAILQPAGSGNSRQTINLNASGSNSIYGNSTTVQPPALTLLPCIKY